MKLEQQVTSLELSKKLKELGVKQESLFWWTSDNQIVDTKTANMEEVRVIGKVLYSAFTVAELGEMLPARKYDDEMWKQISELEEEVCTEANARAKCLIYLLENNLTPSNKESTV